MATADLLPAMALHLVEPSGSTGLQLRPLAEVTGTVGKTFRYPNVDSGTGSVFGLDEKAVKQTQKIGHTTARVQYSSVTRIYAAVAFSFMGLAVLLSTLSLLPGLGALKFAVGITSLIAALSGVRYNRLANYDRHSTVR